MRPWATPRARPTRQRWSGASSSASEGSRRRSPRPPRRAGRRTTRWSSCGATSECFAGSGPGRTRPWCLCRTARGSRLKRWLLLLEEASEGRKLKPQRQTRSSSTASSGPRPPRPPSSPRSPSSCSRPSTATPSACSRTARLAPGRRTRCKGQLGTPTARASSRAPSPRSWRRRGGSGWPGGSTGSRRATSRCTTSR